MCESMFLFFEEGVAQCDNQITDILGIEVNTLELRARLVFTGYRVRGQMRKLSRERFRAMPPQNARPLLSKRQRTLSFSCRRSILAGYTPHVRLTTSKPIFCGALNLTRHELAS